MLYAMTHSKVAAIMVPIDDTPAGNRAIRDMFGVLDREKLP